MAKGKHLYCAGMGEERGANVEGRNANVEVGGF